ncbi:hypothetical protein PG2022B_0270 [Bifidobacterium animalis subsp. animalis]|nr:hypothetical protein PG2022B_0270 [Bifidobacterium animalis subsp. animalis]
MTDGKPIGTRVRRFIKTVRLLVDAIRAEIREDAGATIAWWVGLALQGICLYIVGFLHGSMKICWATPESGYSCHGDGPIYPQAILTLACAGMLLWIIVCPALRACGQEHTCPHAHTKADQPQSEQRQLLLRRYRRGTRIILTITKIIIMVPMLLVSTCIAFIALFVSSP